MADRVYLDRVRHLRQALVAVDREQRVGMSAERAVDWLRAIAETWVGADMPEARAELLHAIYERIVVAGRAIVSARLSPAAYAHGLALALPNRLQWRARQDSGARMP